MPLSDLAFKITAADESGAAFQRVRQQATQSAEAMERASMRGARGVASVGGGLTQLSFQLNDIATGLAMGQSPFTIMAQQGGQVFQIWQLNRNIFSELAGFVGRWAVRLAPVAGIVAGVWGGFKLVQSWSAAAAVSVDAATRALASGAGTYSAVKGQIGELETLQSAYQRAIAKTAETQDDASRRIVASTEIEFNAKKSLLELELKRQQALIKTQQAELATQAIELRKQIGQRVLTNPDLVASGFADPRVGRLTQIPDSISGVGKTLDTIAASPAADKIKELQATTQLTTLAVDELQQALTMKFDGGTPVLDAAGKAAKDAEKRISGVIDALHNQWVTLGMTDRELAVYNNLTAAGVDANSNIGRIIVQTTMAVYDQSEALKRTISQMDEFRSAATDVFRSFKDDLREGKSLVESLGNALDNIGNRLLNSGIDALVGSLFGPRGTTQGGLLGGIGSLLGFADGGSMVVGGAGGPDSQLFAARVTPGERIDFTPPGRTRGSGGPGEIVVRIVSDASPLLDQRIDVRATGVAVQVVQASDAEKARAQELGG